MSLPFRGAMFSFYVPVLQGTRFQQCKVPLPHDGISWPTSMEGWSDPSSILTDNSLKSTGESIRDRQKSSSIQLRSLALAPHQKGDKRFNSCCRGVGLQRTPRTPQPCKSCHVTKSNSWDQLGQKVPKDLFYAWSFVVIAVILTL